MTTDVLLRPGQAALAIGGAHARWRIAARGDTPYLHAYAANTAAIVRAA
jgi:hypothetical protein